MMRTLAVLLTSVGCAIAWAIGSGPAAVHLSASALQSQTQTQGGISLSLTGRGGTHARLAIPAFTGANGDADLEAAAKTVASVLWDDIDFEQEFDLVSREATAQVPVAATPEALPVDRWATLGADSVVLGTIVRAPDGFTIDLRLVGTKGDDAHKVQFGQEYKGCVLTNPRRCAHFMSDDLHKKLVNLDGVAETRLAFTSDRNAEGMTGRRVTAAGQSKEIYISDYDGANEQRITANRSLNLRPVWAPDGKTLAYESYVSGYPDLYVSNIFEARAPTRPAAGTSEKQNQLPAWSPDGTRLAFASNREGSWDIFVVDRDGKNLHNITNSHNVHITNNAPTWSPTGQQIAFTSDRTGTNQIYVIGAEGLNLEKLTSDAHADCPTWSPAPFNKIAFTSGNDVDHDIRIIDIVTRETSVLTDGRFNSEQPSFAPNGRHIAFTTNRSGKEEIAILSITGTVQRQVTKDGGNSYPNWSRLPQMP